MCTSSFKEHPAAFANRLVRVERTRKYVKERRYCTGLVTPRTNLHTRRLFYANRNTLISKKSQLSPWKPSTNEVRVVESDEALADLTGLVVRFEDPKARLLERNFECHVLYSVVVENSHPAYFWW